MTDPTTFLAGEGYRVRKEGRHLSVRMKEDEVYRVTRKDNGLWLWCDRYGNNGGDNIDLVREIAPGTGYAEAVYKLSGAPAVRIKPEQAVPVRHPPQLPVQKQENRERGHEYLRNRGISAETIRHAEQTGLLRYTDGAVLFAGYDREGIVQNVTRRATAPDDPIQKRDLRGSDKSWPPVLSGDTNRVWIVEGGMDALALHDMAKRSNHEPPVVIVSGGANVCSFLERPEIQQIIRQAKHVTLCGENEKNTETQAITDAGHQKQAARVAEITGREVRQWKPAPEQGTDLADMNARQVTGIDHEKSHELSRGSRGYAPQFLR